MPSPSASNFANKLVDFRQSEEALAKCCFVSVWSVADKKSRDTPAIYAMTAKQTDEIGYPPMLTIIAEQPNALIVFVFVRNGTGRVGGGR